MTHSRDFDRIAEAWLAEGPTVLADRVLVAAIDEIHLTRQRRGLVALPRRTPSMNLYAKLAVAAVAVIAIGAIGLAVLGPGSTPGTGGPASPSPSPSTSPSPSPSPSPSTSPSPSPSPSPSTSPSPSPQPALTETFTSSVHGISVGYPSGWNLQPATEPWPEGGTPRADEPYFDTIYKQETDSPFIVVASQPLEGRTLDAWIASWFPQWAPPVECEATGPTTVDGATGVIASDCTWAGVSIEGRAYLIWLYRVDDRAWFEEILATVQLHPEDAVDALPSASP